MSTDRLIAATMVALVSLAPAAARAQEAEPSTEHGSARDLGQIPDPGQRPGELPLTVDDEDPGLDVVEEAGLGSFFLTNFSLGSAYDRLTADGSADPPPPGSPAGDGDDDGGEISYLVRPTFLFVHRPDARGGLSVAYEPEIETLQESDREERVSHSAGVLFERRLSRRTDLTAGASYLDSLDPSRHLGGDGFVLIPGRFEQGRIFFGASHLWPRATRLHVYAERSEAQSDVDTDTAAFDVEDMSGTLALTQGIGRRSDITFSYSYGESDLATVDAEEEAPERFDGPVDTFRVGFGHRAGGGYSFHVSGGALREHDPADGPDDLSWIGSGELARETDLLGLRLRYDRSLFSFAYGDVPVPGGGEGAVPPGSALPGSALRDTVADTVSFHLDARPQNRVRVEQSVWLSRQTVVEGDDIDSFVTGTLVEVLLTGRSSHRLILFSRFDYFDRDESELLGEAQSRTRFSLGFRVGVSGPQTKLGQQLALTELRKVLPTGGRL